MTDEGALLGFNLKKLTKQLQNNPDADGNLLPDYINYKAVVTIPATDGSLTVDVGDEGLAHAGEANPDGSLTHATHVEKGVSKIVSNDGLYWAKGQGGNVLILDEDSGNDYGERKFAFPSRKVWSCVMQRPVTSWVLPVEPSAVAMKRVQRLWLERSLQPAPMNSPAAGMSRAW